MTTVSDTPTTTPLVVRRSPWRGWGWALVGIPFLVIAVDVLFTRYFTDQLLEIIYSTAAETEGTIEIRDTIFAVVFLIVGGGLVANGLKELVAPSWVILGDDLGIEIRSGPFGTPLRYRWEDVGVIEEGRIDIDGAIRNTVHIGGVEQSGSEPWGARWGRPDGIALLAEGWSMSTKEVADALRDMKERAMAVTIVDETSGEHAPSSHHEPLPLEESPWSEEDSRPSVEDEEDQATAEEE